MEMQEEPTPRAQGAAQTLQHFPWHRGMAWCCIVWNGITSQQGGGVGIS